MQGVVHIQLTSMTPIILSILSLIQVMTPFMVEGRGEPVVLLGRWNLLTSNAGISAMHMQLLHNDKVIVFDRKDFGSSNLSLPVSKCDPTMNPALIDCNAHSYEYNIAKNEIRPLMIQTDIWCSSGAVMSDGHLVQTGGEDDGGRVARTFFPCEECDWGEIPNSLLVPRWYATSHVLPDGNGVAIFGGRGQNNYEFFPKDANNARLYNLPFLKQMYNKWDDDHLYPIVFLNTDGTFFIFANNQAILLDYRKNVVVKTLPKIPDLNPRSYPSTGSGVLLPLKNLEAEKVEAEVLICGGAPSNATNLARKNIFIKALDTCGRIKINDPSPQWVMEPMPMPRIMSDMITLPNGDILIINGASSGVAGWTLARDPVPNPVIYKPYRKHGSRFEIQTPAKIPRMYHSSAILLRDGRVLVGGSNTNPHYEFTGVLYPTDLSMETFSPPYLHSKYSSKKPVITQPASQARIHYKQDLDVYFSIKGATDAGPVYVAMAAPSFTTHSFAMNQRLLILTKGPVENFGGGKFRLQVKTPGSANLAPNGYYLLFVVHEGVPSRGIWVHIE